MNKVTVTVGEIIPIRTNEEEVANDKKESRPRKQYHQRFLEFSYPDGTKSNGIIIPGVIVHQELADYFNKTSVNMAVPQQYVRMLQVPISAAGAACDFKDRKLMSDEKNWWTRASMTEAVEGKEQIRTVDDEGEEYYGSFYELFTEYPSSVVANLTCSVKMICETEKGETPKKDAYWRASLKPSMFTVYDAVDIPAPQSGTVHKSIPGKKDKMKSGLKNIRVSSAQ